MWPHLLSLDAPVVALIWQEVFSRSMSGTLALSARLALGVAVWIIYVMDRVLDSFGQDAPLSERHRFYRRYRRPAVALSLLALLGEVFLCGRLSPVVFRGGAIIAALVGLYFLSVHSIRGHRSTKEIAVASLFAAGVMVAPVVQFSDPARLIVPGVLFAVLCLLNCATIEYSEWEYFGFSTLGQPHPWIALLAVRLQATAWGVAALGMVLALMTKERFLYSAIAFTGVGLVWFGGKKRDMSIQVLRGMVDLPLALPALFFLLV